MYDYYSSGMYFITICTEEKECLLSKIVGTVNSSISKFIGTFKRFCNRECGRNLWRYRSYDHVIRGEADYAEIWEYIDTNVIRWNKDDLTTYKTNLAVASLRGLLYISSLSLTFAASSANAMMKKVIAEKIPCAAFHIIPRSGVMKLEYKITSAK